MAFSVADRERLSGAVQRAVRTAVMLRSPVPVREVSQAIISEAKCDPALYDDVLDALCALCVRSGLTLEFTRPVPVRAQA
jgi:nucleotide-binding universal stress UspA family protein